ncbi:hypothetical protein KOR42_00510 [Thalassoglobus neptunius]|uniref:Uncharacterized protein n=1 Tax=Thalassoglobus neptunius TaxID=1938619 RepID=A0A5C5X129_9PLAN|nr:hypothetical protein [Thalassoglobus neptunius]TWT56697.1 hypothetical protein KOR42_00510 [Thalassoglobus neptunius]
MDEISIKTLLSAAASVLDDFAIQQENGLTETLFLPLSPEQSNKSTGALERSQDSVQTSSVLLWIEIYG